MLELGSWDSSLDAQLEQHLELIRLAERNGFRSVWLGEGYPLQAGPFLASPLLVLAAFAPETRLKLGVGVTLLPAWHPLKLAYDGAVLDELSGGRFVLGVGVGKAPLWQRFGMNPAEVGPRADETLALLRALWSGQAGFHGSYYSVDGGIAPLPSRVGGPPIWVAGGLRRSAERAAELGHGYIASTGYPLDALARRAEQYRARLAARGKDVSAGVVSANRLALLTETEAEAGRIGQRYLKEVLAHYARSNSGADPRVKGATADQLFEQLSPELALVGTPDAVLARVRRYAEAGVTHIQVRVNAGETPPEVARRTIELLGRYVLPVLA